MSTHIEFTIIVTDIAQREMLIALLSAAGASGFEEEKDRLKAFVPEADYPGELFDKIIKDKALNYSKSLIKEKNWNAEWEADFKPVVVGSFCAIRAAFHTANSTVAHDIVVTPKMSFGTGHHATTFMMVQAMEQIEFQRKSVFDFGTGTGVLAILAEKLGASAITAIDNDDWSITNATENFNSNNCDKILLDKNQGIATYGSFDIILANINRHVILASLPLIKQHLAVHGVVLFSGLLIGDAEVVIAAAKEQQLNLERQWETGGWICLQMANSK
ncbi:MAG: 50S ribosomal protein L11 methyltransferase [Chitinophagaceae bacterium]